MENQQFINILLGLSMTALRCTCRRGSCI